jgi:hypothetical protein
MAAEAEPKWSAGSAAHDFRSADALRFLIFLDENPTFPYKPGVFGDAHGLSDINKPGTLQFFQALIWHDSFMPEKAGNRG